MTPKRVYLLLIAVMVLLGAGMAAAAYGAQTVMASQSDRLVKARANLGALSLQQTNLIEAKKELVSYAPLYQISKVVVPESKDQAETVRQIVKLASDNDVTLGSITFPSSTLGTGAATATNATAPSAASTNAASNTSLPTNRYSQLTLVPQIPGVYTLPITIVSDTTHPVTYSRLIAFLQALEQNRLTAQVSSVDISLPNSSTNSSTVAINFSLITNIYIKP
jgi:hypothetical protein